MNIFNLLVAVIWLIPCVFMLMMGQFNLINMDPMSLTNYVNVVQALSALVAGILCLWSSGAFAKSDDNRLAWNLVGWGILAWFTGMAYYTYYTIANTPVGATLENIAFDENGGISDWLFLLSIPLIIIGFYYLYKSLKSRITIAGWVISVIVLIGTMVFSLSQNWNLLFPETGFVFNSEFMTVSLYCLLYPILFAFAVATVSILATSLMGRPWIWVIVGILIYGIMDVVYPLLNSLSLYSAGSWIDLAWVVGFMFVGIGAIINYQTLKKTY
ncbi:MAG: hypothetical protein KA140_00820 [Caldisericia bacterium]|nr:hypothetical protein [Caldisericia bacterium]